MSIAQYVDEQIRRDRQRRSFPATVVAKESDGISVMVQRLGFTTPEGPYPTEGDAWGALRVGSRCRIRADGPVPIVGKPVQLDNAANSLQRIGEDVAGGATTSATDWVTLCDVQDLHIGPDAFAIFTFGADIEVNAPQGTGQKQISLMFNDEDVLGIDLGAGAGGYFAAFIIGPLPPWGSLRSVEGLNATWSSVATSTDVQTITRIRIEGRTQDEQNGQDVLRAGSLIVYG